MRTTIRRKYHKRIMRKVAYYEYFICNYIFDDYCYLGNRDEVIFKCKKYKHIINDAIKSFILDGKIRPYYETKSKHRRELYRLESFDAFREIFIR
jgi:hypothetical protein